MALPVLVTIGTKPIDMKYLDKDEFLGYYVYYHIDKLNNNEVVYIGHGTKDRAEFQGNRPTDHVAWMRAQPDIFFEMNYYNSEEEAKAIERREIEAYKPRFNKHYTGRLSISQVVQIIGAVQARIESGLNAAVCSDRVTELNALRFTCCKCGQEGGRTAMVRWHGIEGEKCRKKPK